MNYIQEVLNTLAGERTFEDHIDQKEFDRAAQGYQAASAHMEKLKKAVFYGRDISPIKSIDPLRVHDMQILHAKLGIAGEAGELVEASTPDEVLKEMGDLFWYCAVLCDRYGFTFEQVQEANIEKLRARYSSGKFTLNEANNRG